jgi:hypothetical protein
MIDAGLSERIAVTGNAIPTPLQKIQKILYSEMGM